MSGRQRFALFCIRVSCALILTGLILMLPGPGGSEVLYMKNAASAFVGVIWIGKTLYDTLFEGE